MIINCVGFWSAREITEICKSLFGREIQCDTNDGEVIIDIDEADGLVLSEYLNARPQEIGSVKRAAEIEIAAQDNRSIKDNLLAISQSTVGLNVNQLDNQQLRAIINIMMWKIGALDIDLKIKPLSEWV